MGLFSRKKTETINSSAAPVSASNNTVKTVNPDDIWNAPIRKTSTGTIEIRESKYSEPEIIEPGSVPEVKPEDVKRKMEELERELAAKKDIPVQTYHDFDVNPVHNEEISVAQDEFEKDYAVSHEIYVKSHYQDITEANVEGIDVKISDMVKVHEEKVYTDENTDFGFNTVGEGEVSEKLEKLPYAKKPEDYPEYKDIKGVSADEQSIEKLGSIDHSEDPDNIASVDQEFLDQKVEEFNKKYN